MVMIMVRSTKISTGCNRQELVDYRFRFLYTDLYNSLHQSDRQLVTSGHCSDGESWEGTETCQSHEDPQSVQGEVQSRLNHSYLICDLLAGETLHRTAESALNPPASLSGTWTLDAPTHRHCYNYLKVNNIQYFEYSQSISLSKLDNFS